MKLFVTGACGQLGHDVLAEAFRRGYEAVGSDIRPFSPDAPGTACVPLDITDEGAVERAVAACKPDVIVHCGAWTAVDAAEAPENREKVFRVNQGGTAHLAQAAKASGAKMIYISTDYVFDGRGTRPWSPEESCFQPLNVYGQSKLAGETAVAALLERYFIVRTAWVFGRNGRNFVRTMVDAGRSRSKVRVVNDQIGTPTYAFDLARLLVDMAETQRYGVYHATNAETAPGAYISWYDFCVEIYRQCGMSTRVIPVSTAEYGLSKAARPFNSRLSKEKLNEAGFAPLPTWRDAMARYLKEARLQHGVHI